MTPQALLDSNILIAGLVQDHDHHAPSAALLAKHESANYAVAAHSLAEAYVALTRQGERAPFRLSARQAWVAVASVRSTFPLLGLTPAQVVEVVRRYAEDGGVGRRLYDALIGEVAVVHGIETIITWNTRHMRGLFPRLSVKTPREFAAPDPTDEKKAQ